MKPIGGIVAATLAALIGPGAGQGRPPVGPAQGREATNPSRPADAPRLDMSKAVACTRVNGFEDYVPLPEAKLTSEDKLKVYFRPLNYKVEPIKARYRAKFTEDGRVRRKGEKTPLSKEDKLLDYEDTFDSPGYQIYLVNTIGLKNLPPGEYEFDIILHDGLVEGSSARQTIPFTIIPAPGAVPAPNAKGPGESGDSPDPAEKKTSKKGKPTRPTRPKP